MSTNSSNQRLSKLGPYLPQAVVLRMQRLLHMEYKPSELSEELVFPVHRIYENYIPHGMPFRRDANDRSIWIVGTEFREWANAALDKRRRRKRERKKQIGENQGYCTRCKDVVYYRDVIKTKEMSQNRVIVTAHCSTCGKPISIIQKMVRT